MRNQQLFVLLSVGFLPPVLAAHQMPWVGRWVNIDPTDYQPFVLAFESDGRVHQLIPAPQFEATYSVEAGRLVMRMTDGSVDTSMTVRGDTLTGAGIGAFARVSGAPQENATVRGTWRLIASGPMESFTTFRSDGQVVLEVGFPVEATLRGDTPGDYGLTNA